MNKSKIEWCDHTWNPITGCLHNCAYCYARRMVTRFAGDIRLNKMAKAEYKTIVGRNGAELYVLDKPMMNETGHPLVYPFGFAPTYHRYRLNALDRLKMGNNIFVGAMADIFGEWVPDEWIEEIFAICKDRPQHNYMFLTKNPKRLSELANAGKLPKAENYWWGSTITGNSSVMYNGRICDNTFLSIEPLQEPLDAGLGSFGRVSLIIIGAETGNRNNKVIPKKEWIDNICEAADITHAAVFMKDSLVPIVGEKNMRRELPRTLQKAQKHISPKQQKKLYDSCGACKALKKKSDMITLLARSKRGEAAKSYGFMCSDCFKRHCRDIGCDVPDLSKFKDESEV